MEQKIKFEQVSIYNLTKEELLKFYTTLSLIQNAHLRNPNYNEDSALKKISDDLYNFTKWANQLAKQEPNNLIVHRLRCFFEKHHKLLLEIRSK